jgi:short-subunit dehydrogenase
MSTRISQLPPTGGPATCTPLVVITGASSGIGRATAHLLAQRGYRLVLLARAAVPLADAVLECKSAGAETAEAMQVDITDAKQVSASLHSIETRLGPVDALVHSAGVAGYGRFHEIPAEVFEAVIRTNLFGAANLARSALPAMRDRNRGTLVLVGSVIGHIAVPRMTPYVVSKWAIRSLARQLQLDNRDRKGVQVCLVEPGSVDTPIYRQAATYLGHNGRPPPPVVSPERVARTIAQVLDRPRKRVGIGSANLVMKAGFTFAPKVYDALVGPLFSLAGTDPAPVPPTPGNVLEPHEPLNRLHGDQIGVARAVIARLTRR